MPGSFFNIHFFSQIDRELKEIYMTTLLRSSAFSLISIFVPIYLYTIGLSLTQIFIYIAIQYGIFIIAAPISAVLASKYGAKHTALFSPPFSILYLSLLFAIGRINFPYWIIAIVAGFAMMLFWIPVNSDFAKHHKKHQSARETSLWTMVSKIGAIIGPFIGGLVLTYLTFNILFLIASILLLISIAPLFMTGDYTEKLSFKLKDAFSGSGLVYFKEFFFQGFLAITTVLLFPFYIYLTTESFVKVGSMASIMSVGMAFFVLVLGKVSDKYGSHKILRTGGILNAIVWVLIILANTELQLYVLSLLLGMTFVMINIPIFAMFCDFIKPGKRTEFMTIRDVALGLGRAAIPLALVLSAFILSLDITLNFKIAFGICAIASLYFFIPKKI